MRLDQEAARSRVLACEELRAAVVEYLPTSSFLTAANLNSSWQRTALRDGVWRSYAGAHRSYKTKQPPRPTEALELYAAWRLARRITFVKGSAIHVAGVVSVVIGLSTGRGVASTLQQLCLALPCKGNPMCESDPERYWEIATFVPVLLTTWAVAAVTWGVFYGLCRVTAKGVIMREQARANTTKHLNIHASAYAQFPAFLRLGKHVHASVQKTADGESLKTLLSLGAPTNLPDPEGVSALASAMRSFNVTAVKDLLEYGAQPAVSDLLFACDQTTPHFLRVFLHAVPGGTRNQLLAALPWPVLRSWVARDESELIATLLYFVPGQMGRAWLTREAEGTTLEAMAATRAPKTYPVISDWLQTRRRLPTHSDVP